MSNISIQEIRLIDLLPPNLKQDPDIIAASKSLDETFLVLVNEAKRCILLPNIDELEESLVDHLAWQLHVDFYELDLPLHQKRQLVKSSVEWHRKKGTKWAVEEVVSIIFREAKVSEWFEYNGNPYHFKIQTKEVLREDTDINRLSRIVEATKNVRSHLENVTITRDVRMSQYVGGIVSSFKRTIIRPATFNMQNTSGHTYVGGLISSWTKTTIKAR